MSDSVQSQLEAVLQGIEERVPHLPTCGLEYTEPDRAGLRRLIQHCDCKHAARVRAEQARAVERMLEAGVNEMHREFYGELPTNNMLDHAWAAALRAGEEHQ